MEARSPWFMWIGVKSAIGWRREIILRLEALSSAKDVSSCYPMLGVDVDVCLDQCPVTGSAGIKCGIRKKSLDDRCSFRMIFHHNVNGSPAN